MAKEKRMLDVNAVVDGIVAQLENEWGYDGIREDVQRILDNTPTVDAVEVVRCRDCKHFEQMKSYNSFFCNKYGGSVEENDYCSRAEPLPQLRCKDGWRKIDGQRINL